eukprot:3816123-Prymnesium_polylepis.1
MPYLFFRTAPDAPRCHSSRSAAGVVLRRRRFSTSSCDDACAQGGAREAQSPSEKRARETSRHARRA